MPPTPTLQEEHVPLPARIWISAADAVTAILNTLVVAGAMTYYFTKLRGLDLQWSGLAWLLFGIWNAVNDPLFGYISDRTKSALGRRKPYIRYGAPIFALGFILFWVVIPGLGESQVALFVQMTLALFIFDSLYTAIATSLFIMPYEVAVSNKARSTIYVWKILFMVFTIVVPLVIDGTIKPDVGDAAGIAFFRWFMIAFGMGMCAIIFASTWFFHEKHYLQEEEQPPFFASLRECFRNRAFVVYEVISFSIIFAQTALMTGLWFYFDEIDVPRLPIYIALATGIIGGVVFWIKYRDTWGVKTCTRWFALLFAVGCFVMLLGGRNVFAATLAFFLFGIGFSGGMYLIPLMNGDVVDMDEHRTGLRREGMYAGVNSFVTKPAVSLAQWSMGALMAAYGFDATLAKGMQSPQAETGILVGWTLVTGILMFLSYLALHGYPLAGSEWEQIKGCLAEVHRQKEQQYLAAKGYKFVE
jgi:GPH family glycoside/pentoside/hexuronide:cation symporter